MCDLLLKINLLHAKTLYTTHHMHIVATTDDERLKYPGRVKSKMKLIVKSVHSLFLYHGSLCACTSMSLCNHCGVVYSPFMFHLFIRSLLSPRLVVVFVLL